MTEIHDVPAPRNSRIVRQAQTDAVGDGALGPVIRSALGVMRESAGLIFHVVGLGVALVSEPKTSRPKCGVGQARAAAPKSAKIIAFPLNSNRRAAGPGLNRNRP